MSTTRNHILGFVAGAALASTLVSTTVALATIPHSTNGSITSCVSKKNGAVRIIDHQAGKRCSTAERQVSWFQGPTAKVYSVGRAGLVVDGQLHKVGSFTMPRAGAWTLTATTVVYTNVRYEDGEARFAGSVYGACELRRPDGRFVGGTNATTLADVNGNGFISLSFNAAFTATSTARTATLWCRADNNTAGAPTLATSAVGAQVLATRVAGFS